MSDVRICPQKYFLQITQPGYISGRRVPLPDISNNGIALTLIDIEKGDLIDIIKHVVDFAYNDIIKFIEGIG